MGQWYRYFCSQCDCEATVSGDAYIGRPQAISNLPREFGRS